MINELNRLVEIYIKIYGDNERLTYKYVIDKLAEDYKKNHLPKEFKNEVFELLKKNDIELLL